MVKYNKNTAVYKILEKIIIVCTYGQINLAWLVLLDLINQSIQTIYYSGDCDPEGILIADKLKNREYFTIKGSNSLFF